MVLASRRERLLQRSAKRQLEEASQDELEDSTASKSLVALRRSA